MLKSHLVVLLLFSSFVSSVFATLLRDDLRGRVLFGLKLFAAFVGTSLALGWIMYPFPN